ncbi:ribosomal-processing cysteine protease Prp [Anaerosacchariphilus polymeriproducens]|uniref:Ribosomal processing cysteine protease Prp n=1 Tax=Anaerosacchariphilus polymeriproducens TaxID=1812858 RepID=A0A371ATZ1_9FIRM|nr:ribosomal-processing cysteine protease Prp [Anaerosacchariphilus polymeriproducens]RDU23037.1 ribosomal-processing cysteine protease Prp [Anaerosacchariphilus polymeriproducens]
MIKITIYKDQETKYKSFEVIGHAGFAKNGNDIVCAGVSALVINALNSIEQLTTDTITVHTDENSGLIKCEFTQIPTKEAEMLVDSLVIGLKGIQNDYSNKYIELVFKEV